MYTRWQKGLAPYHDTKETNSRLHFLNEPGTGRDVRNRTNRRQSRWQTCTWSISLCTTSTLQFVTGTRSFCRNVTVTYQLKKQNNLLWLVAVPCWAVKLENVLTAFNSARLWTREINCWRHGNMLQDWATAAARVKKPLLKGGWGGGFTPQPSLASFLSSGEKEETWW